MDDIDIDAGIRDLLTAENINILKLLLRDGNITEDYLINCAKVYFATACVILSTTLIDFFCDADLIDREFAQECMRVLFSSSGIHPTYLNQMPSKTLRKLLNVGAVIPANEECLSKLSYDDFIEHIGPSGVKIDIELEKECIKYSCIDVLKWVRRHSCDDIYPHVIRELWKISEEKIIFYINELSDPNLIDNIILGLFKWSKMYYRALLNIDHQCCEELSIFFAIRCQDDCCGGAIRMMQNELPKFIHPNVQKYGDLKYLQQIDKTCLAYQQILNASTLNNLTVLRQMVYENARILLDYIEMN